MFGMSVNEVPGWLVGMAPSRIGVPVALTPGLLPQLDVSTVAAPALLDEPAAGVDPAVPLLLLLLLQPAAARAREAASRIRLRAVVCLLICSPQGGELVSQFTVTTILIASGGLLIANASAARASGKWCEKTG